MDTSVLLETKILPPRPPVKFISRPVLATRLDAGLNYRLVLISAPAGFGKTTLLSGWTAQRSLDIAWLTVDEGDNDQSRFLSYLIASLRKVRPAIQEGVQPSGGFGLGYTLLQTALPSIINQIQSDPTPLVLIFDDFHLIESTAIQDAVAFLLDHLPEHMHLFITTRGDPQLPLPRLRARGQLMELRQADLRFNDDEAGIFLKSVAGLDLTAKELERLLDRTEGWPAGLQLAGLSMQHHPDLSAFMDAFTGSHAYVADFLEEEVLNQQPRNVQDFLLRTAILERLCAELCEAVTRVSNGQEMLEYLIDNNLFIAALDEERRWYRYHGLFADLLSHQLRIKFPEEIPMLHEWAGEWYANQGLYHEAIQHALQGNDKESTAELISQVAEQILTRSEITSFIRWVRQLPPETIHSRPALCIYYSWALLLTGQNLKQVLYWLHGLDTDEGQMPASALPLYAYIALMQGQEARAYELSRQALRVLPEEEHFLRGIALWLLDLSELSDADLHSRADELKRRLNRIEDTGNTMLLVLALCHHAELRLWQGRLKEAEKIYQQALELGTDTQGNILPVAGEAMIGLGELAREWNELASAQKYLEEGIQLSRQGTAIAGLEGYISLSRIQQALGDQSGANRFMWQARQLAESTDSTYLDDMMVELAEVTLLVQQGKLGLARSWIEARDINTTTAPTTLPPSASFETRMIKYQRLAYAKLLLAEAKYKDALSVLNEVYDPIRERGRVRAMIEVKALSALAADALGEKQASMEYIEHALELAEPGGFMQMFLEMGLPMAQLLYRAVEERIVPEYAGRLLKAFPTRAPTQKPGVDAGVIEALTPREIDVLVLLSEGYTNQEIALRLVLASSTVKVHTRNIYRKLDVNTRVQAVTRAHELGII